MDVFNPTAGKTVEELEAEQNQLDPEPSWGAQGQVPQTTIGIGGTDVKINIDAVEKFGEPIYEIKEEQRSCCSSKRVTIKLRFFPNVVLYHTETQFCCYPEGYYSVAIVKHKIMGITLSKLDPTTCLRWGVPVALLGLVLLIVGFSGDDGAVWIGFGVALLAIGAYIIIMPCFYNKYKIHITLKHAEENHTERTRNYFKRLFVDENSASDRLVITTNEKPDKAFLLHYVYGVLDRNSDAYHVIGHLENDGLCQKVKTDAHINDL